MRWCPAFEIVTEFADVERKKSGLGNIGGESRRGREGVARSYYTRTREELNRYRGAQIFESTTVSSSSTHRIDHDQAGVKRRGSHALNATSSWEDFGTRRLRCIGRLGVIVFVRWSVSLHSRTKSDRIPQDVLSAQRTRPLLFIETA